MQKSYEGGAAQPDILYIQELANISGVSEKDLTNRAINAKDVKIEVDKVEKVSRGTYRMEPNSFSEQSLENLTESNKILAEANKTLADANKTLAEANHVISKNHDELIQLTKMIVANSTALPKNQPVTFGPEENKVSPGFGAVTPSGKVEKPGKQAGKH